MPENTSEQLRRICVFAGSSVGARPSYAAAARDLGRLLAERGLGIVYGGGSVGLMGELADAALAAGGEVIGVLPRGLFRREVAHTGLTAMHEVGSMHERKALMARLADGFIALPGGLGTFDELFEIVTWAQIGIHAKPIGLVSIEDYFAPVLALVDHGVREGFVPAGNRDILLTAPTPEAVLDALLASPIRPAALASGAQVPEP